MASHSAEKVADCTSGTRSPARYRLMVAGESPAAVQSSLAVQSRRAIKPFNVWLKFMLYLPDRKKRAFPAH